MRHETTLKLRSEPATTSRMLARKQHLPSWNQWVLLQCDKHEFHGYKVQLIPKSHEVWVTGKAF